jgi:mono/diheme cytochrome c family protein
MVPPMKTPQAVRAFRARPMSALATLFVIVAVGHAALVGCGGQNTNQTSEQTNTPETTNPTTPPDQGTTSTTPADPNAVAASGTGAAIYAQRCALCHGAEGRGDGPAAASLNPKPRNHTDGSYMNAQTNDALLTVIRDGKGAMPAWKSVLSEEEIQAVLQHVRSLAVPAYPG